MYSRIYIVTLFTAFTIGVAAQSDEVTIPKVGMRDTLVERLVRENITENHGTCKEVIIEAKGWTQAVDENGLKYKYISVYSRYIDSEGKCWLIEYRAEAQFNLDTQKYDTPYLRGNGYGQGLEMKCD